MKVVLQDIKKVYPSLDKRSKATVTAVHSMNLTIPDGVLVGLLGPSGCGKSTTLNMISGLEKPTSGRIFFDDKDVTDISPENRGIGLVFQNYALYPHMTVRENIMFPLENLRGAQKMSREEREQRVLETAKLVQIESLLDRKPRAMSGGQQQRVAIARALVKYPRVLLLDEPLSNLDARLRLATREEICRIQRKTGITTVFVTHDQEEAMSISDIIVVMDAGLVMQVGRPQDVYDSPLNLFTAKFLGTPPINVFRGNVRDGVLYIGDDAVMRVKGDVGNREVTVGIRPEGFAVSKSGTFECVLRRVEVMGRDTSVVFTHDGMENAQCRAIVPAETAPSEGDVVKFSLKPSKVFLFDTETGWRIDCEVSNE